MYIYTSVMVIHYRKTGNFGVVKLWWNLIQNFNERNVDEMLVKAFILFYIVRLFCLVALLWKVKVWQFDPNSPKFINHQSFWFYSIAIDHIDYNKGYTYIPHKPVSSNLMISSLKLVPPVVTITLILVCLPSSMHICDVCKANSLVGTITIAVSVNYNCNNFCIYTLKSHIQHNTKTLLTTTGVVKAVLLHSKL